MKRTISNKRPGHMAQYAAAIALAVAMLMLSASALAYSQEKDEAPPENRVIVRTDDEAALEREDVVEELDEQTYLISYENAQDAQDAAERLSASCEFAEVDSRVYAAEHDAFGEDALDAPYADDGPASEGTSGQDEVLPDSDASSDGEAPADTGGGTADDEPGTPSQTKEGGQATGIAEGQAAQTGQNASGQAATREQGDADPRSGQSEPERDRPLVALVDSGAPAGRDVVKRLSVLGGDARDEHGHATRMYDTIAARAPDADIMTVRVLDASGAGTVADTYAGIVAAIDEGADIINLSLYAKADGESAVIDDAVAQARAAGIAVVTAAGNGGKDAAEFVPANAEGAITAGACDERGVRLPESNYGECVDVFVASRATSYAAAETTGWLASHGADTPIERSFGDGTFFARTLEQTTPGQAGENEGQAGEPGEPGSGDAGQVSADAPEGDGENAGDGQEADDASAERAAFDGGAVNAAAQSIDDVKTAELRQGKDRMSSPIPPQTIILDNGGVLPLSNAKISGKAKWETTGLQNLYRYFSGAGHKKQLGIWVKNPKTDVTIDDPVTLKWSNVASDERGRRLDLTFAVTKATIKQTAQSKSANHILILGNSGEGYVNLIARGESSALKNNQFVTGGSPGVKLSVTCTFTYTGTSKKASGTYLFAMRDLDQPDRCSVTGKTGYFKNNKFVFSERVQLVSGFSDTVYIQEKIEKGDGPDPGPSLLWVDKSKAVIAGTENNDPFGEFRTGFLTAASSTLSFTWWGSGCNTGVLNDYEGVVIRDKCNPKTKNVTDQGIIRKNVNNSGQQTTEDNSRTATSWRKTDMPWKAPAVYTISAKPGYRVTNVSIEKVQSKVTKNLGAVKKIEFAATADEKNNVFATTQDYNIVVTTAKVADAQAQLVAKKILPGRKLEADEFSFAVHEGKKLVAEARNDASGNIAFPPISYVYSDQKTYPVTHTYTISETRGTLRGITYDTTKHTVKVTETYDSAQGKLSAAVSGDVPIFTNTFGAAGGLKVKKVDASTKAGLAGAKFDVYAGSYSNASQVEGLTPVASVTTGANGIGTLANSALPATGAAYTVVEASAPTGYHLFYPADSNTRYMRTFTLESDGQVADLTGDPALNAAKSGSLSLSILKELAGRDLEAGEFEFQLKLGSRVIATASNDEAGTVSFGDIVYEAQDTGKTYHYTVCEAPGDDPQVTYDGTFWTVDATVFQGCTSAGGTPLVTCVYEKHEPGDPARTQETTARHANAKTPTATSAPFKLTREYYANGATRDANAGTALSAAQTSNTAPLASAVNDYGTVSTFPTAGLHNYSKAGRWTLERPGYKPTGYWIAKTPNGTIKIHEDEYLDSCQHLAALCGFDLSRGNVTLKLYAEWVEESSCYDYPIWKPGDPRRTALAEPQMVFANTYGQRCGVMAAKVDAESGTPLAGAVFEVRGAQREALIYDEDGTTPLDSITIETGEDGIARSHGKALVGGMAYKIREVKAPRGYAIASPDWRSFSARAGDGELFDAGTWDDPRLVAQTTITAEKRFRVKTGARASEPAPIQQDQFTFQLLDDQHRVISEAKTPEGANGASRVTFPSIPFDVDDAGKTYRYYVAEVPGTEQGIAYDDAERAVDVEVGLVETESDGATSQKLEARVSYPESDNPAADAAGPFVNTVSPSFDIRATKASSEDGDGDGQADPLSGGEISVFELTGDREPGSAAIPEAFRSAESFAECFPRSHGGQRDRLVPDTAKLAEYGLAHAVTMTTGHDGVAKTTGGALASGKAYVLVETAAPAGYKLAEAPVVYLVGDYAADGSFAHAAYPDALGGKARHTGADGRELDQDFPEAWKGYAYTVASGDKFALWDDGGFAFANEPADGPLGGLLVEKVDAVTGAQVSQARFAVYEEDAFARGFERWRAENPQADQADYLAEVTSSGDGDGQGASLHLEPAAEMESGESGGVSGTHGWASTNVRALPVGKTYRIVETEAPAGYRLPDYDFARPNAEGTGNMTATVEREGELTTVSTDGSRLTFADTPKPPREGQATIGAEKHLTGAALEEGRFTFELLDEAGAVVASAANDGEGAVEFPALSYTEANPDDLGSHRYLIREVVPDGACATLDDGTTLAWADAGPEQRRNLDLTWKLGQVVYDASVHEAVVTVGGEEDGDALDCQVVYDGSSAARPRFDNIDMSDETGGLRLKKIDVNTGSGLPGAVFSVTRAGTGEVWTLETDDEGTAELAADVLPVGSYTVREIEAPEGYLLNTTWNKTVEIEAGAVCDVSDDPCADTPVPESIELPLTGGSGLVLIACLGTGLTALGLAARRRILR